MDCEAGKMQQIVSLSQSWALIYLLCPFQGASSLPEKTEAAVWNKAGNELSILMWSLWGNWCRGHSGNQSVSCGNQGFQHCRTLLRQPNSTATIRWSRYLPNVMVGALLHSCLSSGVCHLKTVDVISIIQRAGKKKIPKHSFPLNIKEPKIGNYLLFGFSFKGMRNVFWRGLCFLTITSVLHVWNTCMVALISRNAPSPKQSTESCFTFKGCFYEVHFNVIQWDTLNCVISLDQSSLGFNLM